MKRSISFKTYCWLVHCWSRVVSIHYERAKLVPAQKVKHFQFFIHHVSFCRRALKNGEWKPRLMPVSASTRVDVFFLSGPKWHVVMVDNRFWFFFWTFVFWEVPAISYTMWPEKNGTLWVTISRSCTLSERHVLTSTQNVPFSSGHTV